MTHRDSGCACGTTHIQGAARYEEFGGVAGERQFQRRGAPLARYEGLPR
jgi:hypothetical protein